MGVGAETLLELLGGGAQGFGDHGQERADGVALDEAAGPFVAFEFFDFAGDAAQALQLGRAWAGVKGIQVCRGGFAPPGDCGDVVRASLAAAWFVAWPTRLLGPSFAFGFGHSKKGGDVGERGQVMRDEPGVDQDGQGFGVLAGGGRPRN